MDLIHCLKHDTRKIIHIDMDCFYAAIEIRDNPSLADQPVAVGGIGHTRGVLCTCNYIAREYGVRSAMPIAIAYQHCKNLIVLPVNINKYVEVATRIQTIFLEFTELVEPLSLDEAYLDITHSPDYFGSATLIARAIRYRIWQMEGLIASAGVAPNKFLAKIASSWKKPNGLFVISPHEVSTFINRLPIHNLFGVGKVTADKLNKMGIYTCLELQKLSLSSLTAHFGKLGYNLYLQCRGYDDRQVVPHRARKSMSVEQTFTQDISDVPLCLQTIKTLYHKLIQRRQSLNANYPLRSVFIKIKFYDFKIMTTESISHEINLNLFYSLFNKLRQDETKPIRLIGVGIHFAHFVNNNCHQQSFI